MAEIKVEIKNIAQIRAAFRKAPALMMKNTNIAVRKSIFAIQRETSLNVGGGRGINVITTGLKQAAARPPFFEPLKATYHVNIFYAGYVHDGTRFMKARPFLQQAVDTEDKQVQTFFEEAVESTLGQISKEAG